MHSLWDSSVRLPEFSSLERDINTEILIIGGGICGILCAYMLDKTGVDYILLESGRICGKTTANTTAKITSQHGFIYNRLIKEFGEKSAKLYYEANEDAIRKYSELCGGIDCDFQKKNSYVYTLKSSKKAQKEFAALKKLGINCEYHQDLKLPFSVRGAVKFPDQAQFNPLKFIAGISPGLRIYENSHVERLEKNTALLKNCKVNAKKIIVATHFPFFCGNGLYFLKMFQHRSYVIALENAENADGMYVDESDTGLSFRSYKNLLLIGGGDHRTGKKGGNWTELENFAEKYYPSAKIKYRWATQDCITLDGMPYIGNHPYAPELYVATGFNKWGMTSSMVSAEVLCDLVTGKENRYRKLFETSRTILRPQLAINAFEAICGYLSFTKKRCPHLGCALKWNKYENTWDCPCHGSRFDGDGKLLEGPANTDLKK